jgi:AcrR family transcriptional regulator
MNERSERDNSSVRRTKKALYDSMISLMKDHSCLSISVKDICEAADVGRSTFYAHYQSQYDLLKEIEDHALAGMIKVMEFRLEKLPEITTDGLYAGFRELLEYIAGNGDSIQALLSENGDTRFQRKYFMAAIEKMRFIRKHKGDKSPDEQEIKYITLFVTGGFIALIQEWLKSGIDTPIPAMAALFVKLVQEKLVNVVNGGKKRREG